MRFAIICHDKPNQASVRAAHRDAHFAHLDHYESHIIEAGPLVAEDGSHSVGSLFITEFPDRNAAGQFVLDDPFHKANIFEAVVIRPYKKLLPKS